MCVLGNQILVVWLPFFLLFARFCGVIKRGDNVDIVDIVEKKKCAYPHGLVHSPKFSQCTKFINSI